MWVTEWQGKAMIGLRSVKKLFYRLLIRPWLIPGETAEQVRDVNSSGGAHRPQLFILATLILSLPSLCPHWCARCSRSHWKLWGGKKTENPRSEKILRGLFFDQVENKIVTLLLESGSAPVYDVPMCIVYRGQKPLLKRWSILTTWFTTCADLLRMKKGFEQAIGIQITVILTNTTFLLFWTPKIKVNPEDIVYGITF